MSATTTAFLSKSARRCRIDDHGDTPGDSRVHRAAGSGNALFVGAKDVEDDGVTFEARFSSLKAKLSEQFAEAQDLSAAIEAAFGGVSEGE